MYLTFRIAPYGGPKIRAIKKAQKVYFWDWSYASRPGERFENLVASQLLKYCHYREDTEGVRMELRYIRDVEGHEIDFVVLCDRKPEFAVECKLSEREPSKACDFFRARTQISRFYQVHLGSADYGNADRGVRVIPYGKFCRELNLP